MADEEDLNEDENAENAEGEEGEGTEKKGGNKKLIIIAIAAIVLLLGAGAGVYFSGILGGADDPAAEQAEGEEDHSDGHEEGDKKSAGKDDHGEKGGASAFVAMPAMLVNLNTEDGVPRYLRLSVQLELADPAEAAAVEALLPRVVDQFQTYLRELRVKDLRGSGGIYRLQTELLWRVNQAAAPIEVKDVLFQEILIQ